MNELLIYSCKGDSGLSPDIFKVGFGWVLPEKKPTAWKFGTAKETQLVEVTNANNSSCELT